MQRLLHVLLSFNGRIKRRTWLVFFFAIEAAEYGCELLFRNAFHISGPAGSGLFSEDYFGDRASMLAGLIFFWPSLALDVKRWHDMGRSGFYTLIVYVPILALYAAALAGTADLPEPQASQLVSLLALI